MEEALRILDAKNRVVGSHTFSRMSVRAQERFLFEKRAEEAHVRTMSCVLCDDESLCMLRFCL